MVLTLLLACTGTDKPATAEVATEDMVREVVPGALLADAWMVKVAAPGALEAMLTNPGWQQWFRHDFNATLSAFAASGGPPLARVHAEVAGAYRQALLLQANATVETYKDSQRRAEDPDAVAYPLAVSELILGQTDAGMTRLATASKGGPPEVKAAAAAWLARLGKGEGLTTPTTEPVLFPLGEAKPGLLVEVDAGPHYLAREKVGELDVKLSDPTALLEAALWHEAAARAAAGDADMVDALLVPWRLPFEQAGAAVPESLPMEALFLGPWTSAGDLGYLAAVRGGTPVDQALTDYAGRSIYAAAVQGCVAESHLNADCLRAAAVDLANQGEAAMATAAGGPHPDHRVFSHFLRAGLLRAGVATAAALDEPLVAGELRLNARDRSIDAAADPLFFLSMAAWDAGQRNAPRAQELLHAWVDHLPGLQAARVPLDALHLRVSRDAGPALPMH